MNKVKVFKETVVLNRTVQMYGTIEEPLFLAKDVAEWIEYEGRMGQMLNTVDDNEKLMHTIYASGQNRQMWFLTEDGLYEVLMQSRKPQAKVFKKQVKEVLKTLRKTGKYSLVENDPTQNKDFAELLSNPYALRKIIDEWIDATEKSNRLQTENNFLLESNTALEQKIEEDKDRVEFAKHVEDSDLLISVGQLAKIMRTEGKKNIGQNRLFSMLREDGFLSSRHGDDWNMPTQKSIEAGLFKIIVKAGTDHLGQTIIYKTPKVTPKGAEYLLDYYNK